MLRFNTQKHIPVRQCQEHHQRTQQPHLTRGLYVQYAMMRAQRTSCLNTDDSWMYEDGHDEIVFSVAKACQLLGIGLCGTEGAYTAEVELLEVNMHAPGLPQHSPCHTAATILHTLA